MFSRKNLKLRDFDFIQDNIEDIECNEARRYTIRLLQR